MRAMRMYARNTPKILVSLPYVLSALPDELIDSMAGIKEVVTLTSDLSRKNLEKDFERMDTPQGTFYRKSSLTWVPLMSSTPGIDAHDSFSAGVYFDILLALDGSEFNAELVCQGEVMGRCTARFR